MEKVKNIPKWVYVLLIIVIIIGYNIATNESKLEDNQNKVEEKEINENDENKEYTLNDFPEVKQEMENIISKLKDSEWFTSISFQYLVGEDDYIKDKSNWIGVTYKLNYNEYEITPGITFTFKNDKIHHIQYTVVGSSETSTQKYNRKME